MLVTVVGTAGPLSIGRTGNRVWVCGAFLSAADARELARLAAEAADQADAEGEEPGTEHPVEPGQFL